MREINLDTSLGRFAGLRSGTAGAPRVLALHGWLDNAASFVPLQPCLGGIDLVALDMPGHGASVHLPAAAEYTVVNTARVVFAAADALGWERFSLLGHSLGGAVASVMAAAAPERIERLCTIESLGALAEQDNEDEEAVIRLHRSFSQRSAERKPLRVFADPAAAVRARMMAGGISEPAASLLVARGLAPARGEDRARGFSWRSDPRLTRPTAVRLSEAQVRSQLAAITCPVRVIYAEPAQVYFPETLRRARFDCLTNADLVVLQGGHHVHMEAPAEVGTAIGDFFSAARRVTPARSP
ncbi:MULTISPECIES: alpha/beta fold hydrolase [unclassified Lysobacter]